MRAQTLPNPSIDSNITFNMFNDGIGNAGFCMNCK